MKTNKMIDLSNLVVISLLVSVVAAVTENLESVSQDNAIQTQHRRTSILDDWVNRGAGACIKNVDEFITALVPSTSKLILNVCTETISISENSSIQRAISTGLDLSYLKIDLRCNLPSSQRCGFSGLESVRIFIGTNTDLTVTGFDFLEGNPDLDEDNQFGGAFYFTKSKITLIDCKFFFNYALYGGAIYMEDSTLTLKGKTSFDQNIAEDYGGALYLKNTKLIATDGSAEFTFNSASSYSSIYHEISTASLKGVKFSDNFDTNYGTTAFQTSTLSLENVIFSDNIHEIGAALILFNSAASLKKVKFIDNTGGIYGAATHFQNSKATLESCVFARNFGNTGEPGADIYIFDDERPTRGGSLVTCILRSTSRNLFCNGRNKIYDANRFSNTDCKTKGVTGVIGGGACNV